MELLVSLVVQLVADLLQHALDLYDVFAISHASYIGQWHGPDIRIELFNRARDVVQNPPAQESSKANCDVEKPLDVH